MLNGDCMRQDVDIVIGGVPTVLEVRFVCLFMSLRRILFPGSVSMNLLSAMRHEVDLWKVEVDIYLLGHINLMGDIHPLGNCFALQLGQRPSSSICFLVYLSLLQEFRS